MFDPRERIKDAIDQGPQLELGLLIEFCRSCRDQRWVEPPFDTMEPEPCPECCEVAWYRWLANPYGIPPRDRCPACGARVGFDPGLGWCSRCTARKRAAHFHQPVAVGQLGLGI